MAALVRQVSEADASLAVGEDVLDDVPGLNVVVGNVDEARDSS
jgi:hypothetical protein